MAQTPEDEWFAADDAGRAPEIQRRPAEDDRPITGDRAPAAIGVVVLGVVALIAVVVALTDSTPSAGQLIPIASLPAATSHVPKTSTSTSPVRSLSVPTTTLKPGDTGSQVKTLQRELRALGYSVGVIDGSYGTQTSKAVSAFQRARHLTVDGIVGPNTLLALSP